MSLPLEWSTAASPVPGEQASGDRAVVAARENHILLAAVDGLGHGNEAAAAADIATAALERSVGADVLSIVEQCHRALEPTRGAALSVASFDCREDTMTWVGVGNVEARLLRGAVPAAAGESLLLSGGVLGHELPTMWPRTTPVSRGDVLIFATDGIQRDFADALVPSGTCRELADHILQRFTVGHDDALVLVARYLGET